ncbi:siderophore-interacting protein [Leucobacter chromiireducens]|uniref:siderophore-interacting protein n=1 Tax=Leucobacter chromiireducens TaxID=283877 RepID=UPI003F7F4EB8
MTESTSPLHRSAAIQSADHNRGLQLDTATVRGIETVTPQLARVVLEVPGLNEEPLWLRPNVAIRFYLDERFGATSRVYTVRAADPATSTVEVDVVRHGAASPMMQWLDSLSIGDTVEFGGPRPHFSIPERADRDVVLFADATSIPALYAILQQADPATSGRGWIATDDEVAFAELPQLPGLTLTRIAPGAGFATQLGEVSDPARVVVWGAGERDEMRQIRSFFRTDAGLAKDDVAVFGYWKRGTTNSEIDAKRLAAYEEALAAGGTVTELDDLALAI